jgi:hypothetical protein
VAISFTDAVDDYPELMELLERRAPAVPRVRLPRIWLLEASAARCHHPDPAAPTWADGKLAAR